MGRECWVVGVSPLMRGLGVDWIEKQIAKRFKLITSLQGCNSDYR